MAHAAFGHNHFFKNNYLFRQWTDADGILDYLSFARDYVAKCEERHGVEAVERVLDAAHALKDHGVNRYAHRSKPNLAEERRRAEEWRAHAEATYNDLWRTVPGTEQGRGGSGRGRGAGCRRSSASSACPRRTCSISSRSGRRGSRTGSAS